MSIPDFGVTTTPLLLYTPRDLALARALNIVITGEHYLDHMISYDMLTNENSGALATSLTERRGGLVLVPPHACRPKTPISSSMAQLEFLHRLASGQRYYLEYSNVRDSRRGQR